MKFTITGHENILSTHQTTLEFTKDDYLTKQGDCILGIRADFTATDLERGKVKVTISGYGLHDEVVGYLNPSFNNKQCMVIRKSDFTDARTIIIRANKSAADIDRRIVERLRSAESRLTVEIRPIEIKAVIFDFDNTLEEWHRPQQYALQRLAKMVHDEYKVPTERFIAQFESARMQYEGKTEDPLLYGRDVWMKDTFSELGVMIPMKRIRELEELYWKHNNAKIRFYTGVPAMLKQLSLKKAVLSDADGEPKWKKQRFKILQVQRYFDVIVTSNDTGRNKPSIINFITVAHKLGVAPEECVMVGDHPETDLINAKKLGMTTVLVRQSHWAHSAPYIDFEIDRITYLPQILKKLSL